MAASGNGQPGEGAGEMNAHVGTYSQFLSMLKVSTIVTVIVTAFVVLIIAN